MLSIKTIRDLEYYLRQLMADYYLGPAMTGKEPPGRWTGKLAADLGLSGTVDPHVLRAMWRRQGPNGEVLRRGAKIASPCADEMQGRCDQAVSDARALNPLLTGREEEQVRSQVRARVRHSVVAWDWTESGVKSLTMQWAGLLAASKQASDAGDDAKAEDCQRQANAITEALHETKDETIAEFERTALFTRTGHHGNGGDGAYRDGRGVVGAKFLQHTNRSGDPQLHIPTVLFNMVQRDDGADDEFRAVYSRAMMRSRLGMGAIGNRVLARKAALLGLPLVHRADGNGFEVGGVREDTMDVFSSRRATVTAELKERRAQFVRDHQGRQPTRRELWAMRQDIATDTRKAKGEEDLEDGELLAQWEQRASRTGVQPLASIPGDVAAFARTQAPIAPISTEDRHRAIRIAVGEVQRQNSTWNVFQLMWELHRALPMLPVDVDPAQYLYDVVAEALSGTVPGAKVVPLRAAPDVTDISVLGLRESDGRSVHDDPGTDLYCTAEHLDTEAYLLSAAQRRTRRAMSEDEAGAALESSGLSDDQAAAARILLSSDRALMAFVGPAGTGKSRTLAAFADVYERTTGGRVIGLALSANAARVLAGEGLAETHTIADFLGKLKGTDETRGTLPVRPGDVVVIDEATQVPADDMAAVQAAVDRAGARTILAGDVGQLGSPEAGGMMGQIARDYGRVQVHEVRRFREAWEGPATLRIREGDRGVLSDYRRHGRIREGRRDDVRAGAVRLWLGDHLAGKDAILITATNADAAELAHDARQELIRLGRVAPSGDILLADGNEASAGDVLRARENTKIRAGGEYLSNRDKIRIDDWWTKGVRRYAVARRRLEDGLWTGQFLVPESYLREHAELAYAGNVHVAEGLTTDTSHALINPGMSRAEAYVAVSRGRERNTLHVVTAGPTGNPGSSGGRPDPDLIREAHEDPSTAEAVLAGVLDNERVDLTATQALRDAQDLPTSMPRLFSLWKIATREKVFPAYDRALKARLSAADYARYLADPERPVLHHQLRGAQLSGHDVESVLDRAAARDMGGARSIAGVLHGRIRAMDLAASDRDTTWSQRTPHIDDPDPLIELCGVLGIQSSELAAVESADVLAHTFEVTAQNAAQLDFQHVTAFVGQYGPAARIELRTADLVEIMVVPGITADEVGAFTASARSGGPYEATVYVNKALIADRLAGPSPPRDTRVFLFAEALRRVLASGIARFEADLWQQTPAPLVIAVLDTDINLTGPQLTIAGGTSLAAASAAARVPIPAHDFEAITASRDQQIGWDTPWVRALTPWHFELTGTCSDPDLLGLLRAQLAKLAVLFTCDRARSRMSMTPATALLAEYRGRDHVAVVPVDERTPLECSEGEIVAVLRAVSWCYEHHGRSGQPDWVSDRLPFVQTRVAQALEPLPAGERFTAFSRAMPDLIDGVQWQWRAFIEGKVGEYLDRVQQVETIVSDTVASFTDRTASLATALTQTILAAVAVLIGSFIAAAFSSPFNAALFRIGVLTYAAYVVLFPGAVGLLSSSSSLSSARDEFNTRVGRFNEVLYPDKVSDIVGTRVADAQRSYYHWLAFVAVVYAAVAIAAGLAAAGVPHLVVHAAARHQ